MYSRDEIKHCLESRWRIKQIKIDLGIFLFILILCFIFSLIEVVVNLDDLINDPSPFLFVLIGVLSFLGVMALVIFPFLFYSYYDYKKILKLSKCSTLYEVILDHPSVSFSYRGAVYYTISIQTEEYHTITLETKPLWSNSLAFSMEEYNNKIVEVLYNQEEGRVIVLGLKNWEKSIHKRK